MTLIGNDNAVAPTSFKQRFHAADLSIEGQFTATPTSGCIFLTAPGNDDSGAALLQLIQFLDKNEMQNRSGEYELQFVRDRDFENRQTEGVGGSVTLDGVFGIDKHARAVFMFAKRGTPAGDSLLELKRRLFKAPIGRAERSPGEVVELQLDLPYQ